MMRLLAMMLMLFGIWGCDTGPRSQPVPDPVALKEDLIGANRILTDSEREDIRHLLTRKQWNMDSTGTGLRYSIYRKGEGPRVETGKVVTLAYEISLITGKVCYTSAQKGPKTFTVGKGGVESGLEEAVLLMRQGDRARLVLPSHLAHGLPGDGDCIPRRAVVIYDIEITSVR